MFLFSNVSFKNGHTCVIFIVVLQHLNATFNTRLASNLTVADDSQRLTSLDSHGRGCNLPVAGDSQWLTFLGRGCNLPVAGDSRRLTSLDPHRREDVTYQ